MKRTFLTGISASMPTTPISPLVWAWIISTLISALVFTSASSLDIGFSSIFFDGQIFPAANVAMLEIIRQIIWKTAVVFALLSLLGTIFGLCQRKLFWLDPRQWYFSALLFLTGPVLIVNEGFKKFWGRARPAEILEFGGSKVFTPALVPADQCERNCSFVSGEGSGAVALAVVVWVLTSRIAHDRLRIAIRISAILCAVTGSFLRIVTGRHFLSDSVFAALIVLGIALLLRPILPSLQRRL
tara:strand:- start:203 stop:928 length:726 start_codon:yes stop_codon:yes gene_type:complete